MSPLSGPESGDRPPGYVPQDSSTSGEGLGRYLLGFILAAALSLAAFVLPSAGLVWEPAVPAALATLAVAQIGVHLVFFLNVTSGPDNTNNLLALAFGVLIVGLVVIGSIWIMAHLAGHH